jgi:hypothetical protein
VYDKLRGLSKEDAIVKYLKVAISQPNYGFTFFPGIVRRREPGGPSPAPACDSCAHMSWWPWAQIPSTEEECLIGISKLGLSLFKAPDNVRPRSRWSGVVADQVFCA